MPIPSPAPDEVPFTPSNDDSFFPASPADSGEAHSRIVVATALRDLFLLRSVDDLKRMRSELLALRDEGLILGTGRARMTRILAKIDGIVAHADRAQQLVFEAEDAASGNPLTAEQLLVDAINEIAGEIARSSSGPEAA